MNEQDQHTQPSGRVFNAGVFGDTADEIEFAALDKARAFFGKDAQLEIIPDYQVSACASNNPNAGGKGYWSNVGVRAKG